MLTFILGVSVAVVLLGTATAVVLLHAHRPPHVPVHVDTVVPFRRPRR